MNRRSFLTLAGYMPLIGVVRLLGSSASLFYNKSVRQKMKIDPNHIMDIHPSLTYKLLSKEGVKMTDGFIVPGLADGMGSFLVNGHTVLIRNHELNTRHSFRKSAFEDPENQINQLGSKHYDKNSIGGTTSIVIDNESQSVIREYLSLSGTQKNCAGGVTPWGTWLSCEESINKKARYNTPHGYVFEVDPQITTLDEPVPLKDMGRFNHEAVAFDTFGNAYLTEDRSDGLIYKFVPKKMNSLNAGDLYALRIKNKSNIDYRNWSKSKIIKNKKYEIEWIKIDDKDPKDDTMRFEGMNKGATAFARGEGITASGNSLFICCTNGGFIKRGQIWKLTTLSPEESVIELWYEVQDKKSLNMPDNLTIAPWGDLIICEDNSEKNRLWGINTKGIPYLIAENNYTGSEFAGVCFSPVDSTMFVNLQSNGMTISIDGNWGDVTI